MSKDGGWDGAIWAVAVVFGIAGAIWLVIKTIEAITFFYQTYTVWFWLIIAFIVISPICFLLRFQIRDTLYNIFNRKEPDNNKVTGNQKDK